MIDQATQVKRDVAADRLRIARANIVAAMANLDTTFTACDCCGTRKYNNWQEQGLYKQLSAERDRLGRIIDQLEEGK